MFTKGMVLMLFVGLLIGGVATYYSNGFGKLQKKV